MAVYQILYWRDIPAQVRVFGGKRPVSRPMPDRFQAEIDNIAMVEGLANNDAYLEQWNWTEKRERPGEPDALLEELIRELEQEFDARTGDG